jgi:succinate dehydrogenase / fumarate reductase iron-sulfur subunit
MVTIWQVTVTCGTCGFLIDGLAHGPMRASTVCQLHIRSFKDGDTLTLEPWRARAFPIIKDLVVDRSAFDRIIQAGGYTSINVGDARVVNMVDRHDAEGFGSCSNEGECEAVCPKEISITNIARMNREYVRATLLRGN